MVVTGRRLAVRKCFSEINHAPGEREKMSNTAQVKQGQEWARQHPGQPAPAKATQDFKVGVDLQNKSQTKK